MKKAIKRTLAILLTLIMLFSTVSVSAFAEENNEPETSTDMGTSVQATSPFGKMLADAVNLDKNSDDEKQGGCYITDITMSGNIANVTFFSDTDCRMIVAIYDENTKEMLSSGITEVNSSSDLQLAKVTINATKIPEYFIAKAFLVGDSNEALCDAFSTNAYTETVSEIMDKDIFDFDAEKVVNLDEETDNNFFVLNDDTKTVTGNEQKNVIISSDVETGVYVFDNIDSQIKNLKVGDSFFLDNGDLEDIYVIKVADIKIDGQKATITAEGVDFEDVFEFMLIDESVDSSDMDIEDAELGDDVESYERIKVDVDTDSAENGDDVVQTCGAGVDETYSYKHEFKLKNKKETNKNKKDDEFAAGEIKKGEITLTVDIKFKAMVSKGYNEVSLKIEPHFDITFSAEGTLKFIDIKLVKSPLTILNQWGAKITIQPAFKVTLNGKIEFSFTLKFAVGAGYDTLNGAKNLCEKLNVSDTKLKLDVTLYIGIDLNPTFVLLHKKLFNMKLKGDDGTGQIGFEANATMSSKDTLDSNHDCYACVSGTINFKIKLELKLAIAEGTKYEVDFTCPIVDFKVKIKDFYWSIDHGEFDWGKCPYNHSGFTFGRYPQSKVTDSKTITELNKLVPDWSNWTSYGYYSGTGKLADGQMKPSDYMRYYDIDKNGDGEYDYRAVKFTSYRPYLTGETSSASNTNQDDNGYTTNNIYYFKYEKLKWRILDIDEGLIMCDTAIDSQAFNNYILSSNGGLYGDSSKSYYASDYGKSSIRDWLNNDFYNTAFNSSQKSRIKKNQTIDAKSTDSSSYDGTTTNDNKVFLLSHWDVLNSNYGFSSSYSTYDKARQLKSTDYAKCQGCRQLTSTSYYGNSSWSLRSPYHSSDAAGVSGAGYAYYNYFVGETGSGIVPALKISNLQSIISSNSADGSITVEDEGTTIKTNSVAETEKVKLYVGAGEASFSGISGNRYMLYSVKSYSDNLDLSSANLAFVNQATAENGTAKMSFYDTTGTTTVIVGDFGNGIEARQVQKSKVYTAKLMVDGKLYKEIPYNEGQKSISLPPVPEKAGYTGAWEPYSLTNGGTTINAVYTPIQGKVKSVSIDDVELNYKKSTTLKPTVDADSGIKYTVKYESSNPKVATVDDNGKVTATKKGKGSATITCTVTDQFGNTVKDTCKVDVLLTFGQKLIVYVLFGWIWY